MGQIPHRANVASISNDSACVVTTDEEHGFTSLDFVRLSDLNGDMPTRRPVDQLNNNRYRIVVIDDFSFYIQDPITFVHVNSTNFPIYVSGGYANVVPTNFTFYSQDSESYTNPDNIVPN